MFAEEAAAKQTIKIEYHATPLPTNLNSTSTFFSNFFGESPVSPNISQKPDRSHSERLSPYFTTESVLDSETSSIAEEAPDVRLLHGEEICLRLNDTFIQYSSTKIIPCTLVMTNYRLEFIPTVAQLRAISSNNPSIYSWLSIPLMCIDRIDREKKPKPDPRNTNNKPFNTSQAASLLLSCKDIRQYRITIGSKTNSNSNLIGNGSSKSNTNHTVTSDVDVEKIIALLGKCIFPNSSRFLFAFISSEPVDYLNASGVVRQYDARTEFRRQGLFREGVSVEKCPWRLSTANYEYKLCPSYPQLLIVPKEVSDEELFTVAAFRSEQRLPSLVWAHKSNGATLWRSSQPRAGVSGSCYQDERFLNLIANTNRAAKPLLFILDCRNVASAMANRAAGAGYESSNNYPNTRIEFLNISNIHSMRESYRNLGALILSNTGNGGTDTSFGKLVEDSLWLTHIRLILKASWDCAAGIFKGTPVLVHCSHGWDRTAQVTAIAQLFLDPYYRTFDGFQVLVEKEWVAFGHPFKLRCAHGQDRASRNDDQTGPIFLQFIDCVWQLVHQDPHYFEFGPRYLLLLASHIYSCRFGTFLCDTDCERESLRIKQRCVEIWTYMSENRALLVNPLYIDPDTESLPPGDLHLPPLTQLLRNVTLWSDYFFRWSPNVSASVPPERCWSVLYEEGICKASYDEKGWNVSGGPDRDSSNREVPALVTSSDAWEAAYYLERQRRLALEARLLAMGVKLETNASREAVPELQGDLVPKVVSHEPSMDAPVATGTDRTDASMNDSAVSSLDGFVAVHLSVSSESNGRI